MRFQRVSTTKSIYQEQESHPRLSDRELGLPVKIHAGISIVTLESLRF